MNVFPQGSWLEQIPPLPFASNLLLLLRHQLTNNSYFLGQSTFFTLHTTNHQASRRDPRPVTPERHKEENWHLCLRRTTPERPVRTIMHQFAHNLDDDLPSRPWNPSRTDSSAYLLLLRNTMTRRRSVSSVKLEELFLSPSHGFMNTSRFVSNTLNKLYLSLPQSSWRYMLGICVVDMYKREKGIINIQCFIVRLE